MTIHQSAIRPALTPAEQRFLDLYASVEGSLPGAQSVDVRARREAALNRFAALGLPHRRVEEWKYTDLRMLMPEVLPLAGLRAAVETDASVEAAIGGPLAHLDAYRAVFIDGLFRPDLSTLQDAPGVSLQSVRAALESSNTRAQILQFALAERDVIAALANVFATDGAILSIEPGTQVKKPIHLINLCGNGTPRLIATQNVVAIGEGAHVSLIETEAGLDKSQIISSTRLAIGAGALVHHVRLNFGEASKHLSSAAISLAKGAKYDAVQMTLNAGVTRAQANIRFEGPGGHCHYSGAMMLRGRSHADFTLLVNHSAPGCQSRELVKAVVDDHSRGVFQAKVVVERGAQKTDGKQMSNALLLSDEAEFDSKPELEIFADDVVCGHGATAGQLNEDQLFYLRARGVPEPEARALLVAGFIGEALDNIENEDLRAALQEKVNDWLFA
ncbi:MAG: Fe-S cluster assembly protein SufD [Rhodomicrobium sp.]